MKNPRASQHIGSLYCFVVYQNYNSIFYFFFFYRTTLCGGRRPGEGGGMTNIIISKKKCALTIAVMNEKKNYELYAF